MDVKQRTGGLTATADAPEVVSAARDEALIVVDGECRVLHARGAFGDGAPAGSLTLEDVVPAWAAPQVVDAARASLAGEAVTAVIDPGPAGWPLAVSAAPVASRDGEIVASVVVLRERPAAAGGRDETATVPRRALLLSLTRSTAGVILLRAPAGYGKTTLLRQWEASAPRPFAWVTVTPEIGDDADAVSSAIARALALAVGTRRGGRRLDVRSFLAGGHPQVLVLDDAHHLAGAETLALVERLAADLPAGSRLVLASRCEREGVLGRLIRSAEVMRLGTRELAMSASEGRALFEGSGLALAPEDVEVAVRRVDGWPLGLHVMSLAARLLGTDAPPAEIGDAADQVVHDVLRDEFLASLDETDREFLAITSVAERLTGELCDAMLGVEGSSETLRRLERSNVPMLRLDGAGEWYQVQDLFRQMLAADLRRSRPGSVRRAHRHASVWLAHHGDGGAAAHHARDAGDVHDAGRLLLELASGSLLARDRAVEAVTGQFTEAEVREAPALAVAFGWVAVGRGAIDQAASYAAVARHGMARGENASGPDVAAALELLEATIAADGCTAMRESASRAVDMAAPGTVWDAFARYLHGASLQLAGEEGAVDALEQARRLGDLLPLQARSLTYAHLALAAVNGDDRPEAQALAESAAEASGGSCAAAGLSHGLLALLRAKAGSDSAARERYAAAVATLDEAPDAPPWLRALTLSVICRAAVQLGNGNDARVHLEAARAAWPAGRHDAAGLISELDTVAATLDAFPAVTLDRAGHLTPAELRVLRLLPTHLSFREIGEHLFLSRHTVKTEAISTYRKLGVTSRSDAVRRAGELGLL